MGVFHHPRNAQFNVNVRQTLTVTTGESPLGEGHQVRNVVCHQRPMVTAHQQGRGRYIGYNVAGRCNGQINAAITAGTATGGVGSHALHNAAPARSATPL